MTGLNSSRYFKDLILFWKSDSDVDNEFTLFGDTSLFEILKTLLLIQKGLKLDLMTRIYCK